MMIERVSENIDDLTAVVFVPSHDGKRVRRGMRVMVNPSTVKAADFGSMLGIVTSVSEYPATQQGLARTVANEKLVQDLMKGGPPIQIIVKLLPDASNHSGFRWTSSRGPNVKITSGTLCNAHIVVEEVPPVSYVIPFLKKVLLGAGEGSGS